MADWSHINASSAPTRNQKGRSRRDVVMEMSGLVSKAYFGGFGSRACLMTVA